MALTPYGTSGVMSSELIAAERVQPEQFFSPRRGNAQHEAYRSLWRAVLEEAIHDVMTGDRKTTRQKDVHNTGATPADAASARRWIFGRHYDTSACLDFESICIVLGFEPDAVRESVRQRMPRRKPSRGRRAQIIDIAWRKGLDSAQG